MQWSVVERRGLAALWYARTRRCSPNVLCVRRVLGVAVAHVVAVLVVVVVVVGRPPVLGALTPAAQKPRAAVTRQVKEQWLCVLSATSSTSKWMRDIR